MTLRDLALKRLAEISTEKAAYEARSRRRAGMSHGTVLRCVPWDSACSPRDNGTDGAIGTLGTDAYEERAAILEYEAGLPCEWAAALARLDPARPPCDVSPMRWLRFIDDCGRFLDDGWARRALVLGWGPLELFGCNRDKPSARISQAGLVWLLEGRKLVALTAETAAIATQSGGKLNFYRRQLETGGVPAWELGSAEQPCRTSPR
jgi:hypothetical protein